jgi:hypothetical protein
MAHKASRPVRKAKVEMLDGQLKHFIMYDDETPLEMFNRLKKLVDRSHIDKKIDDGLHSNKLQCCGLDPPRPRIQEDVIR